MSVVNLFQGDYGIGISPEIAMWGDSLTQGAGSTQPITTMLQNLLYPRLVINYGIGGQSLQQISMRQGSNPFQLTISGNAFSGTSAISVTYINGLAPTNSSTINSSTIYTAPVSYTHLTLPTNREV